MKISIPHQPSYSRLELLIRTFFGVVYIAIPHQLLLLFVGLWGQILLFFAWFVCLFTGKYPKRTFNYMLGLTKWQLRVQLRLVNLSDDYPAFGLSGTDKKSDIEMEYPESVSRLWLLLRAFFGFFYVIIPHYLILIFRSIAMQFLVFIAWFVVLFTGKYPASWFNFNAGTIRWAIRVGLYMKFMTDQYPPFSGKE